MKHFRFCPKCRADTWFKFLGVDIVKGHLVDTWECEACKLTLQTFLTKKEEKCNNH